MNDASISECGVVSDCLSCQAEHQSWARTSRALALRRTRSLWARAIRITFFGLPARVSRRGKAAKSGLCGRTSSAMTNRIERMPLRPPRTERLPLSLPLSRAIGARPASLLTALLERGPDFGQLGHQTRHCTIGNPFDLAPGEVELVPQRIGCD